MKQSVSRFLVMASMSAIMCAPAISQVTPSDGYLLRLTPKVGSAYRVKSVIAGQGTIMTKDNLQPQPFDVQMTMSMRQNVLNVDADKNTEFKYTFEGLNITANGSPVSIPPASSYTMQIKMNPMGAMVSGSGIESVSKLMPNANIQNFMNNLMGQSGLSVYPDKPVKVGDTWQSAVIMPSTVNGKVNATNTLEAVDDAGDKKIARINTKFVVDLKNSLNEATNLPQGLSLAGTLTGNSTSNVDLATGMTLDSNIDLNTDINVSGQIDGEETSVKLSMAFTGNVAATEIVAEKPAAKATTKATAKPAAKKTTAAKKPVKKPVKK